MRQSHEWVVKSIKLDKTVKAEYEFEALQQIANEILEGRFKLEIEKVEVSPARI